MDRFEETLGFIDKFCKEHKFNYTVIGGIAVINYNYHRTTNDIDIIIKVEIENLQILGEELLKTFKPAFNNALDFFKKNFVLPSIYEEKGVRIDISAAISVFDNLVIQRSKRTKIGNTEFSVCSIEDLILYKIFASRYQDLGDIQQLFKNNTDIDKEYLTQKAGEFIEIGRSDILDKLNEFLK